MHRLEQDLRLTYPVEGGHHHGRNPIDQWQQETGDQSHVVIERQPRHNDIRWRDGIGLRQRLYVIQYRPMREHHSLLETRGATAVLEQRRHVAGMRVDWRRLLATHGRRHIVWREDS